LYHHRRIARSPKVVIGTPDSWEPTIATSGDYQLCTWSPCGQFIAAWTKQAVEIRNQLTLELITILRPTEVIPDIMFSRLAYSPDGRFIACASNTGIIIWDIQTGGVAKEIQHRAHQISQVWSSDGGTICTIEWDKDLGGIVHIHDISSGTTSSPGTLQSYRSPYLWVDDKSFWIITMRHSEDGVDIFKVGSTLTKIRSFNFSPSFKAEIGSFSPTTHRVSISRLNVLRIFDIQNSRLLLDTTGVYLSYSHCFSPDGSLFAASQGDGLQTWEYASGRYTRWREFRCQDFLGPLFSPTSSSILGRSRGFLQVLRLHELPTTPEIHHPQLVGLSRSGTHVATAHKRGETVTITDLLARTPPQFIDTNVEIEDLFLTGNVLLVAGSEETVARLLAEEGLPAGSGEFVAWLLTEEGLVDGVIGDRRVGRSDSIWTKSRLNHYKPKLGGQVGVIEFYSGGSLVYHTETGEVLDPTQAPPAYGSHWYYNNIPQRDTPPEDAWQNSRDTLREGWVKDPEGKHRMWVPVEWRERWNPEDWHHDATTQFSYIRGRHVLIRF